MDLRHLGIEERRRVSVGWVGLWVLCRKGAGVEGRLFLVGGGARRLEACGNTRGERGVPSLGNLGGRKRSRPHRPVVHEYVGETVGKAGGLGVVGVRRVEACASRMV